jgi:hypothetical protein
VGFVAHSTRTENIPTIFCQSREISPVEFGVEEFGVDVEESHSQTDVKNGSCSASHLPQVQGQLTTNQPDYSIIQQYWPAKLFRSHQRHSRRFVLRFRLSSLSCEKFISNVVAVCLILLVLTPFGPYSNSVAAAMHCRLGDTQRWK